ncbi:unnamed protein product, partial [Chrysoparadoxa australica]
MPSLWRLTVAAPQVQFVVEATLGYGEVVYVCGSCASLGGGDPKRAVELHTDPESYPTWTSELLAIPTEEEVNYKYCVFTGGEFQRWEDIPRDRILLDIPHKAGEMPVRVTIYREKPWDMDSSLAYNLSPCPIIRGYAMGVAEQSCTRMDCKLDWWIQSDCSLTKLPPLLTLHSSYDGVIVVSYFLPVHFSKGPTGEWVLEWDYENLLSLHNNHLQLRVTRVGFVYYDGDISANDEAYLTDALRAFDCVPVFLEKTLSEKFYNDFCKGILWPVFHHVLDVYGNLASKHRQPQLSRLWQAYSTVNTCFRDKVVEVYNEGDLIWVHGFHLLLLPSFLQRRLRGARVALFMHTPFPSSEIFRVLPFRVDLLRGMLNADQIGFHLFEYSRHFLTCCRRILGLHESMHHNQGGRGTNTVFYNGRSVTIESIHAGIDASVVKYNLSSLHDHSLADVKDKVAGRFMFVGIDKVEKLKGLQLKFSALQIMLEKNPGLGKEMCLVQVGLSARERIGDFNSTLAELRERAAALNDRFGSPGLPVVIFDVFDEHSTRLQDRMPYLALGDALIITTVRDGLNRIPMEFTLVHHGTRAENPGVLVLSEFTSCMRVLRGAVTINPWKVKDVAQTMSEVMEMPREHRIPRHEKNVDFCLQHTTQFWAFQLLRDLKGVVKSTKRSVTSNVGLGLNFRVIGMDAGFQPLDANDVIRHYRPCKHRLIVLDYGGTILHQESHEGVLHFAVATNAVQMGQPPQKLKAMLQQLAADPRNMVFVVSGRAKSELNEALGDVKGLGLAGEHGLFFKWPKLDAYPSALPWEVLLEAHDDSWMVLTKTIMDVYHQRTNGTYIEEKGSALLWQFKEADPEFGFTQSRELEDHLVSVLKPFSVEILRGGGTSSCESYIEVRNEGVNKGTFVTACYERMLSMGCQPDFVLAMGDEASDEVMFETVNALGDGLSKASIYSTTVGKKPSEATTYLNDIAEVYELV